MFRPIRLEVPAARTTAATRPERSSVMDASLPVAQVLGTSPRVDGEHLGHDADCHLLRTVGAEIEPDRREEALAVAHAELLQDVLLARPRSQEAHVRDGLVLDRSHPLAIVLQRVHLDDEEGPAIEGLARCDEVKRPGREEREKQGPRRTPLVGLLTEMPELFADLDVPAHGSHHTVPKARRAAGS